MGGFKGPIAADKPFLAAWMTCAYDGAAVAMRAEMNRVIILFTKAPSVWMTAVGSTWLISFTFEGLFFVLYLFLEGL